MQNIIGIFGTKVLKYEVLPKERYTKLLANNRC